MNFEFTDTILEMNSCDMVTARISKDDTLSLFKKYGQKPKNQNLEPDDDFAYGEVQFLFDKGENSIQEILLFPVYADDSGEENGDFINVYDDFKDRIDEAYNELTANS